MTDTRHDNHNTPADTKVPAVMMAGDTPCLSNGPNSVSGETCRTPVPLAICGMAMRLPGNIKTGDGFWDLLVNKRDARAPIPPDRRDVTCAPNAGDQDGAQWTTHGYMLSNSEISTFDGSLFSMTRSEVERTDPQQRLLLELARECFENAGETAWRGKQIAVYIGSFGEDWNEMQSQDTQDVHLYTVLGSSDCFLSNRISYEYNLSGPSLTVRTACSASLYALHLACQAVQIGQASSALVGGASLNLSPSKTKRMYATGALSVDASSKAFDADADGYARAEAVNMVFVKRLDDALRDGNPVRAILRTTAVNSDGKTPGITRPSSAAHEALIRSCYRDAGLDHEIGNTAFFECHATGTSSGDPMETTAVANIFGEHGGVYIGSVKPNMGHSEGAAGLTSLIKCVLALERKAIPPNIKFDKPNPNIPFDQGKLRVPTDLIPWPKDRRERVSINSFGVGGANAHAIIDSAASFGLPAAGGDGRLHSIYASLPVIDTTLLVFTANHPNSLKQHIEDHREYIAEHPGTLDDVAYTLGMRREHLAHRAFALASSSEAESAAITVSAPCKVTSPVPEVAFVFTGQGAQWATMAANLIRDYPSPMDDLAAMDDSLSSLGPDLSPGWTLADELGRPEETSHVHKAELSQPLCAAIQVVIVNLLRRWGISPVAVIGHSSGEIAAAYACGAMTMHEAIICAYLRGKVTALGSATKVGGMAAIGLGSEHVQKFLFAVGGVTVACENSPSSTTISGDKDKVLDVLKIVQAEHPSVFARMLKVDMAYHSHHMEELGEQYEQLLRPHISKYDDPFIPFFSTVTGTNIDTSTKLDARYWRTNLESPVRFNTSLKELISHRRSNKTVLVEIGPHSALSGPIRQIVQDLGAAEHVSYLATLCRGSDDTKALLTTVGHLFCQGHHIRFDALNPQGGRVLTDLPTYPWNRDARYWHETRLSYESRMPKFPHHELLGSRIVGLSGLEPSWRNLFRLDTVPWCRDHRVGKDIVFPAAGYLAMATEAVRQLSGGTADTVSLRQVHLVSALILTSEATEIVLTMRAHQLTAALDSAWYDFTVSSCGSQGQTGDSNWIKHCFGQVRTAGSTTGKTTPEVQSHPRQVSSEKWYKAMSTVGLHYGPHFQQLGDITASPVQNAAVARLRSNSGLQQSVNTTSDNSYFVHPTVIDSCLQLFTVALSRGQPRKLQTKGVPTYILEAFFSNNDRGVHATDGATASATVRSSNNTDSVRDFEFVGDCMAVNQVTNDVFLRVNGVQVTPLDNGLDEQSVADCHGGSRLYWQRDIDLCSATDVANLLHYTETASREAVLPPLQKLLMLCCLEAAELLQKTPVRTTELPQHLIKFQSWIQDHADKTIAEGRYAHVSEEEFQHLTELSPSGRREAILDYAHALAATSYAPLSDLVCRIYSSTRLIFSGEIEALEVLRRDDGLTKLYNWVGQWDYTGFLRLLTHRSPRLRVLEIGAGTGGTTDSILAGLTSYDSYTFSDISAAFFPAARERFKHVKCVEFKTLDISCDPMQQGFEAASFDLIIAANVLHATPSLRDTLVNVRKLLRPDGRLLLQELCPTIKWSNFIMGGLPGWWLGEADGRSQEPYIPTDRWTAELADAGFCLSEMTAVHDHAMPSMRAICTIIATPSADVFTWPGHDTVQILSRDPNGQIASDMSTTFQEQGLSVEFINLNNAYDPTKPILSILDLEGLSVLENMTAAQYQQLQAFFSNLSGASESNNTTRDVKGSQFLLWLTRPCQVHCESTPQYATILGLLRVLRSELGTALVSLEMDEWTSSKARDVIWQVYSKLGRTTSAEPMIVCAVSVGQELARGHHTSDLRDTRLRVEMGRKGILNSMQWVERPRLRAEDLDPLAVSIEVKAVGMNFKDSMIALGMVKNRSDGFGIDCAGIVTAVGTKVDEFTVGDRVMGIADDAYATVTTTLSSYCVKIPDGLTFEEAACMPAVYATVIYSLLDLARLEKGQSILIHSACGGVGIAALNICRAVGLQLDAEVFATVGNEEKVEFLMTHYGIPRRHIFCSRDAGFLGGVMGETGDKGVDVVLNSLSGELLHASWQCVAEFGSMIELGKRDFIDRGRLAMDHFEDNRSFFGVDLGPLRSKRPGKVKDILNRLVKLYVDGDIQPIRPIRLLDAADMPNAIRTMQKGQHIGKLVVAMPQDPSELSATSVRNEFTLRDDASYLLAGGLGGLGRSIAVWMAEHGAKNLVFITRGDGNRPEHKSLIHELGHLGCTVQLARLPIAGVLHLAMVLQDSLFAEMPFDAWESAMRPKVLGAWNLHSFEQWDSRSARPGQLRAANTFLDAFVQFRQAQGLPASVIDLGVVGDVGYVSERKDLLDRLKDRHTFTIYEQQLLDAVELSIKQSRKQSGDEDTNGFVCSSQLLLGLRSQAPLADQNNRTFWKRDARVASQGSRSNLASIGLNSENSRSGDSNYQLGNFLAEIEANPGLLTTKEGVTRLARHIGSALCAFVMKPESELDLTTGFASLGIDSLVAIEMRNWSRQRLGLDISVLEIMRAGNIMSLAEEGAKKLMARYSI
ncbi:putative polyketide synthase [Rhypophila decipiens]|uniref:Polyketide synthase n=1 Tax=Rhypophila decipiens TaxID=261697 RepID=A0AAN6YDC4_9PEZI|nr:putative polyketide synthase [Rhypophila decipiens]